MPGAYTGGATPVPIPNTEVKPSRANGTALAREWESRSVPGLFYFMLFLTLPIFCLSAFSDLEILTPALFVKHFFKFGYIDA